MKRRSSFLAHLVPATMAAIAGLSSGACDSDSEPLGSATENIEVTCLDSIAPAPPGAWLCPESRTIECGAAVPPIFVRDPQRPTCSAVSYEAQSVVPLRGGTHPVRVSRDDGTLACETTLTVADRAPPVLTPKTIDLWPPNHKFHSISVADCVSVSDSCESGLRAEFVWASSDEPIDARGDGHHAPDIRIDDCNRVQVRSERQGPRDGRVYKLGVRVVDSAGNAAESACTIIVDHDKRGVVGSDSGEQYRIIFDGQNGLPQCDGERPPPPPPATPRDAGTPPPPPPPTDAGVSDPMAI